MSLIEKVRELLQELAAANDSPEGHILGWLERHFAIKEEVASDTEVSQPEPDNEPTPEPAGQDVPGLG